LLQARFGDAGRGLMMPGFPFPYYKAPGFRFEKTGTWKAANSLTEDGTYGITGVSLTSGASDAALTLSSPEAPFASAEVWLLAGPDQGRAVITAGAMRKEVATAADRNSVLRVALPVKASSLKIEVVGDGPVTVLGWSVEDKGPGIRYVNLGIPSASALTTNRFDRRLATSDIAALAPDLIILGYGTNEGFNDDLDLAAYERDYERLIKLVTSAAPEAALIILGPVDGNRLPRFVKGDRRAEAPCRPLTTAERTDYSERLAHEDPALARWHEPPKLDEVGSLLAKIADRHGAAYWSLSGVMGGPCSIHRWLLSEPPLALPDHVHLSDAGSKRMGRAIYQSLMSGYDRYRQQASLRDDFAANRRGAKPPEEP
jgi:lysophospholipase L1-like esterase